MAHRFTLRDEIIIHAPIERCFQLSTSLAVVEQELGMRPVSGRTSGLVTNGDTVLWQRSKFGLPQFHESLIEALDPPHFFRDRMIAGRFRTFEHDHAFEELGSNSVRLTDELRFSLPFGPIGELVATALLIPHIRDLMHRRFQRLKQIAESEEWRQYLPIPNP
jgi:ligand-binding SRPBCC domain-containing protein